jgi:transposase
MRADSRKDLPVDPDGRHVVGIDIGQKTHAAAGLTAAGKDFGRKIYFPNSRAGLERLETLLLKALGGPQAVLIGMEATGHYWMPLHTQLTKLGYTVAVVNPIQTSKKFRTCIRKTKTDKLDAQGIARLVLSGEAKTARIPNAATLELRLLVRHRWRLMGIAGDLERFSISLIERLFPEFTDTFPSLRSASGRSLLREIGLAPELLAARSDEVTALLRRVSRKQLSFEKIQNFLVQARQSIGIGSAQQVLVEQLRSVLTLVETIESQIDTLDKELESRMLNLESPLKSLGLHAPLIATIHAESDPIHDFQHVWQYAAYTGLDPATFQSGNKTGTRIHISKRGSPYLRQALYLAAFCLYRRQRPLQRLYQKCRKSGHHHIDALVIVAHKLARIIWRMLTDNRPFHVNPPKRQQLLLAASK